MAYIRKKPKRECLWMVVTLDKYELPVAVFDTIKEMAEFSGTKVDTIYQEIAHVKCGIRKRSKYQRIYLDEV